MAYDPDLADRIREVLAAEPELTEKKMFGGLAFLVSGRMALAVSGSGGLMVRVERDATDHLIVSGPAEPMVMHGREVKGWVRLASDAVRTRRQLDRWVARGVAQARPVG